MLVLGISAFYHDSAAVLCRDGVVVCALEEERFTRIKHDNVFPVNAIRECLRIGGVSAADLTAVAYYEKPLKKFERILENFLTSYPFSYLSFVRSIPEWLFSKIKVEQAIRSTLLGYAGQVYFVPHHASHAAAAFFTSPFDESAVLTVDGVGEYQTTGLYFAEKNELELLVYQEFPNSLGLFYSTFTAFLGFQVNEGEYKVMGMAAFGSLRYMEAIEQIVELRDDGSIRLDMSYFDFSVGKQLWTEKFQTLFGAPRTRDSELTQQHMDIAASVQEFVQRAYYRMLYELHKRTGQDRVCIGGGVALNALANGQIVTHTPFSQVHILGCSGDSAGALGSALYVSRILMPVHATTPLRSLCLGTEYTHDEIVSALRDYESHVSYVSYASRENDLLTRVASMLQEGKVVGWFQGKMEFGPRALGARSILARPSPYTIKDTVNEIKHRELFRPFAASVLEGHAQQLFDLPQGSTNYAYMNFCFPVKESQRKRISALVHADGSCRVQTVVSDDGRYYKLLKAFYDLTEIPCLLNTSFNIAGEPIVETPLQAIHDFLSSKLDCLVLEDCIVVKRQSV